VAGAAPAFVPRYCLTAAFGAHPGIGRVMLIFTGLPFLFILLSCFSAD
jgi:hypothetical protein